MSVELRSVIQLVRAKIQRREAEAATRKPPVPCAPLQGAGAAPGGAPPRPPRVPPTQQVSANAGQPGFPGHPGLAAQQQQQQQQQQHLQPQVPPSKATVFDAHRPSTALLHRDSAVHATSEFEKNLGQSTLAAKRCWLCETEPASPFFDALGTFGDGSPVKSSVINAKDLCTHCFQLAYKAVVQPVIALDRRAHQLASQIATVQLDSAERKETEKSLSRTASLQFDREAAASSHNTWSCPRCTFLNAGNTEWCAACLCVSPRMPRCVDQRCNKLLTDPCKVNGKPHKIWECEKCTVMNSVDADECQTCRTQRAWRCGRCNVPNFSRKTLGGEKICIACGHVTIDFTASVMAHLGLDPAEQERERKQQEELEANQQRLEKHLRAIGVTKRAERGDGNCQFRSLASQLFNNPELHVLVRHLVTEHMTLYPDEYAPLFISPIEFIDYIQQMKTNGTWGDQLTLRAAADCFGVHVHVVTSNAVKWHMHFAPRADRGAGPVAVDDAALKPLQRVLKDGGVVDAEGAAVVLCSTETADQAILAADQSMSRLTQSGLVSTSVTSIASAGSVMAARPSQHGVSAPTSIASSVKSSGSMGSNTPLFPRVFLCYCSPVHYDSVLTPLAVPNLCTALTGTLKALEDDEQSWDGADADHRTASTHTSSNAFASPSSSHPALQPSANGSAQHLHHPSASSSQNHLAQKLAQNAGPSVQSSGSTSSVRDDRATTTAAEALGHGWVTVEAPTMPPPQRPQHQVHGIPVRAPAGVPVGRSQEPQPGALGRLSAPPVITKPRRAAR